MKHRTKQAAGSQLRHEDGFTVVELMVATIVSSFILLACTAAVIQVGKMFYRGVTAARTQEAARTITDEVSRPIQFSSIPPRPTGGVPATSPTGAFCVGTVRYTYIKGRQVVNGSPSNPTQTRHALWRDNINESDPCVPVSTMNSDVPTAGGQELLGLNMRLMKFSAVPVPNSALWELSVKVAYGDDNGTQDIFVNQTNADTIACRSSFMGAQFCAISELNTAVKRRLR